MSTENRNYITTYTAEDFVTMIEVPERAKAFFEERLEASENPDREDSQNGWILVTGDIVLSGHEFSDHACFFQVEFKGNANFRAATFTQAADFSEATFTQAANFSEATFKKEAYFLVATFNQYADFSEATFSHEAYFVVATFNQDADFVEATFTHVADFELATFTEKANFMNATFKKEAYFSRATFNQDADFREATFTEWASFSGAKFTQAASFMNATFTAWADFRNAKFTERARFMDAKFTQAASFMNAKFTQVADFHGATFNQDADFSEATFTERARFMDATFSQEANFSGAVIEKSLEIISVSGGIRTLVLDSIEIRKDALFAIRDSDISRLQISNLTNNGRLILDRIKPLPGSTGTYIHLGPNTDLGQAEFSQVAFDQYQQIAVQTTTLRRIVMMGGYIPHDDKTIKAIVSTSYIKKEKTPGNVTEASANNKQEAFTYGRTPDGMRQLYEQLTLAMKQQGDHYHTIRYYRAYQHWLAQSLKDQKDADGKVVKQGKRWWDSTRLSLWAHRWSSNYGTSWGLAFRFTLGFAFLGYCATAATSGLFTLNPADGFNPGLHLQAFARLFSPFKAHENIFSNLTGHEPRDWSSFVQLVFQVFIAFGVYQTIAAFRSSGKTQG